MNDQSVLWLRIEIQQRAQGFVCPIMNDEPGRFLPPTCFCDIPKTREQSLAETQNRECSSGPVCLPRIDYPDQVGEEVNALPAKAAKRPRGSWTASFRK